MCMEARGEGEGAKLLSRATAFYQGQARRQNGCLLCQRDACMDGWQCARRDEQQCRAYDAAGGGPRCVAQPYETRRVEVSPADTLYQDRHLTCPFNHASAIYGHTNVSDIPLHVGLFYAVRRVAMGSISRRLLTDGLMVPLRSTPPLLAQT